MIRLAEFIAKCYSGKVVEVGVGNYFAVAERLAANGFEVIATDVRPVKAPKGVKFYIDDVTRPKIGIYAGASLIYSIRPPQELFAAISRLAEVLGADCIIKPLYGEYPEGELVNYRGLSFYLIRSGFEHDEDHRGRAR